MTKLIRAIDGKVFPRTEEKEGLTVRRLKERDTLRYAPRVLELLHASYSRLFVEGDTPSLSQAAVDDHFGDTKENIDRQVGRMETYLKTGHSAYWLAFNSVYPCSDELVGVLKTSASRPGKLKGFYQSPNCFINDLAARFEGLTVSRALMHVALTDFRGGRHVLLNAQDGNEQENEWLLGLGFQDMGAIEPFEVGEEALGLHRYVADGKVAVRGLQAALLDQSPWLADSIDCPPQKP